jgi:hypothetical protein
MMFGMIHTMGAVAVMACVGAAVAFEADVPTAHAFTAGMERRGERRDTRQQARSEKHHCNASGGKSRSECRQTKRHVKQEGRHD